MNRFFAEQPNHANSNIVADPATVVISAELAAANLDTRPLRSSGRSALPAESKLLPGGEAKSYSESVESVTGAVTDAAQTHSRYDPISGRWTIFAAGRDERPNDFISLPPGESTHVACPFCSGNEHQTPAAVLEVNAHQCDSLALGTAVDLSAASSRAEPWVIRVIPNKYPAVNRVSDVVHDSSSSYLSSTLRREDHSHSLFRSRAVAGGHEVFIESPNHEQSILTLDLSQVTMLLRVYQERLRHWRNDPAVGYLSLFKNVGPAAGASLHHSHSQLIATTELPIAAKATAERMKLHWAKTGCCLQCDTVRAEVKARQRIVAVTDSLVAYCPFGSHLPMLLRITTRRHKDCYEDLTHGELEGLAKLLRGSIRWLQEIYPDVAYNYLIHTRPPGIVGEEMSHWSLEIFPRITQVAGFEWSSDCMINPILPEVAAASYREVAASENPLR